jgi:uncharacterized protein YgiM (DUF1202 family)
MNKTIWTILGTLMATGLFAQDNTNSLPAIPPPVSSPAAETAPAAAPAPETAPPAPKPVKHTKPHVVHHAPATPEPSVTLSPGPADVNVSDLTVRGQAGLKGDVVTHLHKGDSVTVLEQINLAHHAADEPNQWAKIAYPASAHVWLDAKYVDASGNVTAKKLNLRSGPGENYSVVGVVEKGASVTQIQKKGDWMQIQPPANAFAFVAARYLKQEAVAAAAPPPPPEMPPVPTQVPPQQQLNVVPPPPPAPPTPTVRIVQHEGVVGSVGSPTAPADYKLYDLTTKKDIDFLYPSSPNMDFSKLVDDKVIVSGEEGIQANWPNTPVMAVQEVQVVETNVIKHFSREDLAQPRQRH